jgi:hypothetical protein
MTTTKEKVGIGAITLAVLALVTALVNFGNDHWTGSFGGDRQRASVAVGTSSAAAPGATTVKPHTSAPAQTQQVTDIYLSRDAVSVDSRLDVSGEGFAPSQKVIITISTFEVARPTANAQGGFKNVAVRIPDFFDNFQKPMVVTVNAESKPSFWFRASRDLKLT